jgi:hypothetical protein
MNTSFDGGVVPERGNLVAHGALSAPLKSEIGRVERGHEQRSLARMKHTGSATNEQAPIGSIGLTGSAIRSPEDLLMAKDSFVIKVGPLIITPSWRGWIMYLY